MPKRPNDELIVGSYELRSPDGKRALRFETGATFRIGKTRTELDDSSQAALDTGTWALDKDQLTVTSKTGQCEGKTGVYKVVISKIGIHFATTSEACEARKLDGLTWWRSK